MEFGYIAAVPSSNSCDTREQRTMIYYLVAERQTAPMQYFLASWGKQLVNVIKVVSYESLLAGREKLPERKATYVFTSFGAISRMDPRSRSAIGALHDRLVKTHGAQRVHNDPARSLRRYELLRVLHERGINSFNAYRSAEPLPRLRFPLFIRDEVATGSSQLLLARNLQEFGVQMQGMKRIRPTLSGCITIEFCDTADSRGIYRKYGAFVIGDRIIPRHIFFSRNWHVRSSDLVDAALIEEESAYLDGNPHTDALLECARHARISYGRIDYALLDGRPQIWEINTNAALVSAPGADSPQRAALHSKFANMYTTAMLQLDEQA
jgi:hypothetical protein